MNFTWEVPTRIHFGTDICEGVLAAESNCLKGCKSLSVYTGHPLRENGTLVKLQRLLQENGCTAVLIYGGHVPILRLAKQKQPENNSWSVA